MLSRAILLAGLVSLAGCGDGYGYNPKTATINANVIEFASRLCTPFDGVEYFKIGEYVGPGGVTIVAKCNNGQYLQTTIPLDTYNKGKK